jgi:MFS family permease
MAAIADVQSVSSPFSPEELARQRRWVMLVTNVSHGFNHLNSGVMGILYAVMMTPLGFGYAELGLINAVHGFIGQGLQAGYGFITQFMKRSMILGVGNTLLGVSTLAMAGVTSFAPVVVLRGLSGAGTSPQHVVGASILSSWFVNARGRALALHTTAGSIGTVLALPLAGGMLALTDNNWRLVLVVIGIPSVLMGLSYFLLRDIVRPMPVDGRTRVRAGWGAYLACLKNRDFMLISSLMMVGAAGREGGITQIYLPAHFINNLGIAVGVTAGLLMIYQVGGLVAPMFWGWLSDVFPRKFIMQIALILTAATTVWLGQQMFLDALLIANLVVYGLVAHSRQAITQAMVGDYAGGELQDAAFSLYYSLGLISGPIWAVVMGALMEAYGFGLATQVVAGSYIVGMLLLIPLNVKPKPPRTDSGVVAAAS